MNAFCLGPVIPWQHPHTQGLVPRQLPISTGWEVGYISRPKKAQASLGFQAVVYHTVPTLREGWACLPLTTTF